MKAAPLDKKKKLIIGGGVLLLIVVVAWLLLGNGQQNKAPKMMSAKQAITKAKAEIAARDKAGQGAVASQSLPVNRSPAAAASVSLQAPTSLRGSGLSEPAPATQGTVTVINEPQSTPVSEPSKKISPERVESAPVHHSVAVSTHSEAPVAAQRHDVSTAPASDGSYYHRVSRLSEELRIRKLQAQIDKLKVKGKQGKSTSHANEKASPVTVLPNAMTPAPATDGKGGSRITFTLSKPSSHTSGTHLVSVMGVANHYQAVLKTQGASLAVHEGSRLSSGWVVTSISPSAVRLERGKHHKTLHMGN